MLMCPHITTLMADRKSLFSAGIDRLFTTLHQLTVRIDLGEYSEDTVGRTKYQKRLSASNLVHKIIAVVRNVAVVNSALSTWRGRPAPATTDQFRLQFTTKSKTPRGLQDISFDVVLYEVKATLRELKSTIGIEPKYGDQFHDQHFLWWLALAIEDAPSKDQLVDRDISGSVGGKSFTPDGS